MEAATGVIAAPGVAEWLGTTGRPASDGAGWEPFCSVADCSSLMVLDPVAPWGGLDA